VASLSGLLQEAQPLTHKNSLNGDVVNKFFEHEELLEVYVFLASFRGFGCDYNGVVPFLLSKVLSKTHVF
jgi:hypothetical protein